jgi:hypothetical protein
MERFLSYLPCILSKSCLAGIKFEKNLVKKDCYSQGTKKPVIWNVQNPWVKQNGKQVLPEKLIFGEKIIVHILSYRYAKMCSFWKLLYSVVEPDPEPEGSETFGRIRIRSGTDINVLDPDSNPDSNPDPKPDLNPEPK